VSLISNFLIVWHFQNLKPILGFPSRLFWDLEAPQIEIGCDVYTPLKVNRGYSDGGAPEDL